MVDDREVWHAGSMEVACGPAFGDDPVAGSGRGRVDQALQRTKEANVDSPGGLYLPQGFRQAPCRAGHEAAAHPRCGRGDDRRPGDHLAGFLWFGQR